MSGSAPKVILLLSKKKPFLDQSDFNNPCATDRPRRPVHDGRDKGVTLEIGKIGFLGAGSQILLQALPALKLIDSILTGS